MQRIRHQPLKVFFFLQKLTDGYSTTNLKIRPLNIKGFKHIP